LAQDVQPTLMKDNAANLKKSTLSPARSPTSRSEKAPRIPLTPKKSLEKTFKPPKDTRTLADPWAKNYDTLLALPPSSAVFTKEVKSTKHALKSSVAEKSSG
uniref:ZC3H14 n=1 Tax=Angiostrongylus cantonensis TaxID=6313 RepID=A0A0K0D7Q2_ANGCA